MVSPKICQEWIKKIKYQTNKLKEESFLLLLLLLWKSPMLPPLGLVQHDSTIKKKSIYKELHLSQLPLNIKY